MHVAITKLCFVLKLFFPQLCLPVYAATASFTGPFD